VISPTSRHCLPLPVQVADSRTRSTTGLTKGSRFDRMTGLPLAVLAVLTE
jgi:hypothetical protein